MASKSQQVFIMLTGHTRECSHEKDFDPLSNKSKQICLPIEPEEYNRILLDAQSFRHYLDSMIEQYAELFPLAIQNGYKLHDILPESQKLAGVRLRRIEVLTQTGEGGDIFTIRPSLVMPYMTGYTDDIRVFHKPQ